MNRCLTATLAVAIGMIVQQVVSPPGPGWGFYELLGFAVALIALLHGPWRDEAPRSDSAGDE